jgi:tetratricopeptide (TPR) repeat protein
MRKIWGILGGAVILGWCIVPPAWGWEHPLVNSFQEAQGKEKEIFSVLPELKDYFLRNPSPGSVRDSLAKLTKASPSLGEPALVNFYSALLYFWAQDVHEGEKYLERAKSYARENVGILWLMTQRAYQAGWQEAALKTVEDIKEGARDTGVKDLKLYSQTLVNFAEERARTGDYPGAEEWLKKAELLSSRWPGLYFARAQINLKKGYGYIPEAAKAVVSGYTAGWGNPWTVMSWSSSWFYALHWLLIFLFLLAPLCFFIRNNPLLIHDFQEFLTRGRSFQIVAVLMVLILFLPLLLGFGLLWQGLFWFLLFFPYAKLKEKIWSLIFLGLLLAIPFLLSQAGAMGALFSSSRSQLLMVAQESGYDAALVDNLKTLKRQEPKNPLIPYLLGLLYYRSSDFTQAESEFKTALGLNPRWYPVMVDLGNTYFGMNSLEQAAEQYQKALSLQPNIASAHYNISQIYTRQLKLNEAREEYDKASKIDSDLVASYEQSTSPRPNRRLMEQYLGINEFLAWALPPPAEVKLFTQTLWADRLAGIALAGTPPVLALIIILSLGLAFIRKRKNLAYYCQKCGQPYCKKCHSQQRGEHFCLTCNVIYIKKDAVMVQRKVEKEISVQKYQKRRRLIARLLNLVLPGLGHFYWGDGLKGLCFGGFSIILIIIFLLPPPSYLPPLGDEPYRWRTYLGAGLLALHYVMIQLDLQRRVRIR